MRTARSIVRITSAIWAVVAGLLVLAVLWVVDEVLFRTARALQVTADACRARVVPARTPRRAWRWLRVSYYADAAANRIIPVWQRVTAAKMWVAEETQAFLNRTAIDEATDDED